MTLASLWEETGVVSFGGRTTLKLSSDNGAKERLEVPSLGGRELILGGTGGLD